MSEADDRSGRASQVELVGREVEVDVGPIAHGGHCVARLDGQVVFVRHTLPGERVIARITEGRSGSSFLRADAVEILRAAEGRVPARCPVSGPGRCGGCDFQHVDLLSQRELLTSVVREQLLRLAGIDWTGAVEAVDDGDGLGWRTRVDFAVDPSGRLGFRRHRSHQIEIVDACPIADRALDDFPRLRWPGERVEAVVSSRGERLAVVDGREGLPQLSLAGVVDSRGRRVSGRPSVTEGVRGRDFRVSGSGFWQVHSAAARTLVDTVLEMADPQAGETVVDLYAGVGLFARFLAERVRGRGRVVAVEGSARAARDARHNLRELAQANVLHAPVERALRAPAGGLPDRCDVVVLDPPRVGARSRVVRAIAGRRPERVVYVACDPAALARDLATFAESGYRLRVLRAFAMFPMTHHVECVAQLTPDGSDSGA